MMKFDTPEPITTVIEVAAGAVHLVAEDRDDTVVDVRPRDPDRASDVRVASQTRVDFRSGTLTISAGRRFVSLGSGGAVDVEIALPSGSRLQVSSSSAAVCADGVFADCRLQSASGGFDVGSIMGNLKADTASGSISVVGINGDASISTASGATRLGQIVGSTAFRSASGGLAIGQLRGDLSASTASGAVSVANAVTGDVSVQTGSGDVEVGIASGTAARLDVRTGHGVVRNDLAVTEGPAEDDETLVLGVRSGSGDVVVRRATVDAMS